jgi:methionyl-tRNA formyltransferase
MSPNLHHQLAHVRVQLQNLKRLARGLTDEQRRLLAAQLQSLEAERVRLRQQLREDPTASQRRSRQEEGKADLPKPAKPLLKKLGAGIDSGAD